jgi:hypothetical protein
MGTLESSEPQCLHLIASIFTSSAQNRHFLVRLAAGGAQEAAALGPSEGGIAVTSANTSSLAEYAHTNAPTQPTTVQPRNRFRTTIEVLELAKKVESLSL